jgi:hypothetical protein
VGSAPSITYASCEKDHGVKEKDDERQRDFGARSRDLTSKHRYIAIDGVRVFYREAGPTDASVILLSHGYPSSSFQFRNFLPALADRWRLIAPDYPGFGYSDIPASFAVARTRGTAELDCDHRMGFSGGA